MKVKAKTLNLPLILIVFLGLFFRLYNFEKGFSFAHDQDLYSWIAKDIVVNHHQRLVGQITSVDGVFIGSFYYYLMAVFYGLFKMNPMSAVIPVTAIGIFNIVSIYWIFKKHFGVKTAYVGAFLYSVSMGMAMFDRWSVPTQPTLTWAIWFLETIIELYKGNLKYLPLFGFLAAFTWQVHIALLPILPLPILAYLVNGNKIQKLWEKNNWKIVLVAIGIFLIVISPFIMFEVKHDFSQIKAMAVGINKSAGGPTGLAKLLKVVDASGREFQQRILFGFKIKMVSIYWMFLILSTIVIVWKKKVEGKLLIILGLWYGLILLAQFTSKRIVSEYYFTNLVPVYLLVVSILLGKLVNKKVLMILGIFFLGINGWWVLAKTDDDQGYFYRLETVDYIKSHEVAKKYPCIAVNFIADPGVGVGFRYLFWYRGVTLVKPGTPGVPIYNVAIPWQISQSEESSHFGRFGVVTPVLKDSEVISENCNKKGYQLDPLLGYVE